MSRERELEKFVKEAFARGFSLGAEYAVDCSLSKTKKTVEGIRYCARHLAVWYWNYSFHSTLRNHYESQNKKGGANNSPASTK